MSQRRDSRTSTNFFTNNNTNVIVTGNHHAEKVNEDRHSEHSDERLHDAKEQASVVSPITPTAAAPAAVSINAAECPPLPLTDNFRLSMPSSPSASIADTSCAQVSTRTIVSTASASSDAMDLDDISASTSTHSSQEGYASSSSSSDEDNEMPQRLDGGRHQSQLKQISSSWTAGFGASSPSPSSPGHFHHEPQNMFQHSPSGGSAFRQYPQQKRQPLPGIASIQQVDHQNQKAIQSMQRIISLNQTAIDLTKSSQDCSSSKDANSDRALDALHKAEWIRCHLFDELAAMQSNFAASEDASSNAKGNMASSSTNNKKGLRRSQIKKMTAGGVVKTMQYCVKKGISSSFTSGCSSSTTSASASATTSSRLVDQQSRPRPKYMKRSGSFTAARSSRRSSVVHSQHQPHQIQQSLSMGATAPSAASAPENVARTSYIYQRMDFDEGMHSFINLESIDPSTFWLSSTVVGSTICTNSRVLPCHTISPVVEATLVFNVGQVHRHKGDLDEASKCYDRALSILRCNSHQNHHGVHLQQSKQPSNNAIDRTLASMHCHPIAIPILHNIGQLQYRRGDMTQAMETYTLALRMAQLLMHGQGSQPKSCQSSIHHLHVASALNCLGVLYYHDANSSDDDDEEDDDSEDGLNDNIKGASATKTATFKNQSEKQTKSDDGDKRSSSSSQPSSTQRAMELFQQALTIRINLLGHNHVDVATILNNIGRIHVQLDQFDEALEYYTRALQVRKMKLGKDSLDYAATAFNTGQSYHQKGELNKASELYHEFLRVALQKFGNSHRDVAVVLSGIAQIHQEQREYEKALELYEESLCAGRAALGENHSEIAMLLNRMGNFHFEQERLDDALRCYQRGLKIERQVLPADHPNIIVTLSNLGEIHRQRSEWDEAASMYGDCLDILRKKHNNENHIDVASTLSTIGLIHDQRGDTCLSLHYLQDALLMRRRLLGNDHLDVSANLVYIGTILYRKSVFSVALELFTESLRIRMAALGKDHRDVAFALYNIALVHQQRGCYEEAIESYSETLRIEKLVLGTNHRDVSMTLFKLGEVNKAAGDLDEALRCFQSSLDVERSMTSSSDASSAALVNNNGDGAGQRRQQQQVTGPDHAAMARALNEIGNIHLARGDVVPMMAALNEASRLYRQAGLSPTNVVVSGHLYALEFSCPEAAPAA